jgi:hypothetical protein
MRGGRAGKVAAGNGNVSVTQDEFSLANAIIAVKGLNEFLSWLSRARK